MNEILCPECFARLYPKGREEKCCTHGCSPGAKCVECGARRTARFDQKPYWHCLGTMSGNLSTDPLSDPACATPRRT